MKTNVRILTFLFAPLIILLTGAANAQETLTHAETVNITVQSDHTESYDFGKSLYVKTLILQAEGIGQDSTIEVMVNGNIKGTIHAPGRDPSYVVTIEEQTRYIEFRHRSGASMRIIALVANVIDNNSVGSPVDPIYSYKPEAESLVKLCDRTIQLIINLVPYSNLADEAQFLVPIKIKAGELRVMALAHGAHSTKTLEALQALQNQIAASNVYLFLMMESESLFDQVVELYGIQENIKALLN